MPMYKGRNISWDDIFPIQPVEEGMKTGFPLDILASGENVGCHFLGGMPIDAIENVLPICPCCHDTKSVIIDSTVKIPSTPIYTLTCERCMVKWESNLTWRD